MRAEGTGIHRVVIAPDSFKGTIRAADAALAIADGWLSVRPGDEIVLVPIADGGEGTIDAFATAVPGAVRVPVSVVGPLGLRHDAEWLRMPQSGVAGDVAVVELAGTAGIELIPHPSGLRPLDASSRGFGEAIRAAIDAGVHALVLAIGSSASSDGGAGMLQALGAGVLDAQAHPIGPGASGVATAASVDLRSVVVPPPGGVTVLTDVSSPLLGPDGAASVFGPQKGASRQQVGRIEAALHHWSSLLDADPDAAGAGAAGGVGFALLAWGAQITPGAEAIARLVHLEELVRTASVVITGEGRYDGQSDRGKAPSVVLAAARRAGARAAVVAGVVAAKSPGVSIVSLAELSGSVDAAMSDPARWLARAGSHLATSIRTG